MGVFGQRRLGLGGADEAQGKAEDQGGTPRSPGDQLQQPEQRRGRVADGDHRALKPGPPQLHRRGRAGGFQAPGQRRHFRVTDLAHHVIPGRKAGDALGDHVCVHQNRRAGLERLAARRSGRGRERQIGDDLGHGAGMHQPERQPGEVRRDACEVGLAADPGQ